MVIFTRSFKSLSCFFDFWSYSLVHVGRCGNIYCIFDFWSYSTRHVRRCGNFYFKFWSSLSSECLSMSVFGHVHRFRSYSFGHIDSVMLTTLILIGIIQWFSFDVTTRSRICDIYIDRKKQNLRSVSQIEMFFLDFFHWGKTLYFNPAVVAWR